MANYLAAARELIDLAERPAREVEEAVERSEAESLATGFLAGAAGLSRLLLCAEENGLSDYAAPTRRALGEFVAAVGWLANDGSTAVRDLKHRFVDSQKRIKNSASGTDYDVSADAIKACEKLVEVFGAEMPKNVNTSTGPHVRSYVEKYHTPWLLETQRAHPTITSAGYVLDTAEEGAPLTAIGGSLPPVPGAQLVCALLVHGIDFLARIAGTTEARYSELEDVLRRHGVLDQGE
ncbi:hypothetical protein QEZ40_003175 [Streptomyces katrae]|uniref:Uncharacterized protein n=1 Tax=Streptomyces katrae TaxID=68223 RepID=A0ABT7GZE9_9ACTN|nr:hypothetical protein [Streptomyces katrae]MDK9498225.1 hypothetical protein [Streptomyces katrae]